MKTLFINANLYGHINPTLGLVKEMVDRGHEVHYFCAEAFSEKVEKEGARWIGYSKALDQFLTEYRPTDRHPFFMLMEYMLSYDEKVLPELLNIVKNDSYDLIICDSYFGGACFLSQLVHIPVICSHSSFAMSHVPVPDHMLVPGFHPQLDNCYSILRRICEQYQIKEPSLKDVFISKSERNIVYTIQSFNGDGNVCEPEYLFLGPSLNRLQEERTLDFSKAEGKPIIYISLGSVNTDFILFYKTCISAFKDMDYYVYMSIGKKTDISLLGEIPSNFYVDNFLPQLQILSKASAFITHAGFNSVNEALHFGVPMLALPLVNDQMMVAKKLTSMQLGMTENMKELSAEKLQEKVQTLITDKLFSEHCHQMSLEMRQANGYTQIVKELEDYVGKE